VKLLVTRACGISISVVFDVFQTEPDVTRFQFRVKSLANESGWNNSNYVQSSKQ
jgi:hypothetical protein